MHFISTARRALRGDPASSGAEALHRLLKLALYCVPACGMIAGCQTGEMGKATSVMYNDLGKSVEVIGPLGEPPGKLVTIEGRWVRPEEKLDYWSANMAHNLFRVETVNGRALARPAWIELLVSDVKTEQTGMLKFEGFQQGGFVNWPMEAEQRRGEIMQSNGWHFAVEFVVVVPEKTPA